jgi:protein SCO1/2
MFATFSWKSFGISSVLIAIFIGYGIYLKREKELMMDKERRRSLGRAAIGGTFDLIDQDGKPVSSKDLLGKWVLLYFGFSHCPDICPEEMEKMVAVTNQLEKFPGIPEVIPLFITVDPERDTPQVVKSYIREFSPKIIGLTGTKEQVDKATKAYRVYYSAGPKDGDQDYIVDHTIIMYLINPNGEFVDYYGQTRTAEQVTNGIVLSIKKFENMNKKSWF